MDIKKIAAKGGMIASRQVGAGKSMIENRHVRRRVACERGYAMPAHRAPVSHVLLALLASLALMFQALVVQTHVHIRPNGGGLLSASGIVSAKASVSVGAVQVVGATASAPRNKNPITDDSSNCPMCQQMAHSGPFVESAAVLAALPNRVAFSIIFWTQTAIPSFAATHIWKSRAPPIRSVFS